MVLGVIEIRWTEEISRLWMTSDDLASKAGQAVRGVSRADLSWLTKLKSVDTRAAPSPDYIAPITAGFRELVVLASRSTDYSLIENILKSLEPPRMRTDAMVAVLRTLFPVRAFFTLTYVNAVRRVSEEIASRDKRADRILKGLL